jgi:hypothetical protein
MVTLLTVLLGISIVGLISLVVIKRWELSRGTVVMGRVRPAAGLVLGESLNFIEHHLPALVWRGLRRSFIVVRVLVQRLVAWTVIHIERWLERSLSFLRGATQLPGDGEVSGFLREVAEHKKALQKSSKKKRNAIYEE